MVKNHPIHTINLEEMLNDASIDRILAIGTDWKIIAWNKTSENVAGIKKQEILGKHLLEIFPQLNADPEMISAFQSGINGNTSYLPSKPGIFNRSFYENHFIPLKHEDGSIFGVLNIMHDVAHRIKAERQLQKLNVELKEKYQQLEKVNTELATFTSITGNDLKEPVKKIYTALEMIINTDGQRLSNTSKAKLRRMQASLNRINLHLDDILALSTVSSLSLEFTQVTLQEILNEVLASLNKKITEKNAIIETGPMPTITGSPQMLNNLFCNLIENALKFHVEQNRPVVSITSQLVSGKPNQAEQSTDDRQYVCITITDNGIGFDQGDAEKIFTMFERLHSRKDYPGSGIGLTICRKIAESHGGYLEAESVPGKGSSFKCYLPLTQSIS